MKCWIVFGLVLGSAFVLLSGSPRVTAQVCHDEEDMVSVFKKAVADLVETVKKESLGDFEKAFHQKSTMTKMSLLSGFVEGLLSCLQKRANDPTTLKEDAAAAKAKIDTYNKLKAKIQQDRDALKAAHTEKEAKALIEKFAYTK
jgi:Na+-transporting NADH:ubiquinone oxidoreductase subunit NqrA